MTGRKGSRLMEFLLPEDVRNIILNASVDNDVELNHAWSLIVREWQESKEIEPLKYTPNVSDLNQTVHFRRNIEDHCEVTECNTSDKPRRRSKRK